MESQPGRRGAEGGPQRLVVLQHHATMGRALARRLRHRYASVDVTTDPFAVRGLLLDETPVDLVVGALYAGGRPLESSWVATWRDAAPWLRRVVVLSSEPHAGAIAGVDATFRKPHGISALERFLVEPLPVEVAS